MVFVMDFASGSTPRLQHLNLPRPSAVQHPSVITENLAKEVSLGRVFGPTPVPAVDSLQINR